MFLLSLAVLPFVLESRPTGGPGSLAPDRSWDLQHLHLDLDVDPAGEHIEGSATLTLRPLGQPSTTVVLDQVGLDVHRVLVDGEPVPFRMAERSMEATVPARAHDLTVEYGASPRAGLHFRGAAPDTYTEVWSQGEGEDNRFWIPLPDHPNDRFTTSGRFQVPEGYKVLSNGLGSFDGSAWNYALEQDLVSYLVMLAVGPYTVQTETWRGRPVEQWLPPDASPAQALSVRGKLPQMLDFFSEKTGVEYPYPAYREVYVQRFLYTGMENTTSTVMARRVLLEEDQLQTRRRGTESVMAHELAHQWYGDALTCATWNELWLNEGFATFMAAEWMRQVDGDEAWASGVASRYRWSRNKEPLAGRFWSSPDGDHAPSTNVYSRGASLLQMLRVMLGEEVFWQGIELYTTRHAHSLVETDDLRRAMEELSGQHLQWFFDQWAHLGGAPKVEASWTHTEGELRVTLKRSEGEQVFPLEVEAGGELRRVWVDEGVVKLLIPMEQAPLYVAVDPRGGLLAELTTTQSVDAWIAQATTSPHPYAQVQAIEALGEEGGEQASAFLIGLAEDLAAPWAFREWALRSLKTSPWEPVHAGAARLLEDPDARIRQKAAEVLGSAPGDHSAALEKAWRRERVPDVRATLLTQWARQDRRGALDAAERWLVSRRPGLVPNPVAVAALNLLGDHGDPDSLDTVLRYLRVDSPQDLAHAAAWAAPSMVGRMDPGTARVRAQERSARALEPLLESPFQRTRATAIGALGRVGDEHSVLLLQAYAKKETVQSLEKRADDAIKAIRERDDSLGAPDEGALEERLLALEEQQDAMRERLEKVEERR